MPEEMQMKPTTRKARCALLLLLGAIVAAAPALADKPERAGKGKGKSERGDEKGARNEGRRGHFKDQDRAFVRDYYAGQYREGSCPPGLAKKHNGCMPPGQ